MKNLISMTDFVNKIRKQGDTTPFEDEQMKIDLNNLQLIFKYAKFLSQPLKLEMFVPCDEDGNPLKKPSWSESENEIHFTNYTRKYNQAKEKVLFEGFKQKYVSQFEYQWGLILRINCSGSFLFSIKDYTKDPSDHIDIRTIEDLCIAHELKLTENALKQIGL